MSPVARQALAMVPVLLIGVAGAEAQARRSATKTTATTSARAPSDRAALLARAESEAAAGRRAEAARTYATAADRFGSVVALVQLARLQAGTGDHNSALATLQRARELAPNSEEVLSGFVQVSLTVRAITPALIALQALTRMCPTVAQYHYLLGVGLMQAGDFVGAVDALVRADELEPGRALTLIARGIAYNGRKMYAEARPFLLRGLALEPDSVDAIAALAESEEGLGDLEAAERHAREALAKARGHANANLVMGLIHMKRGQYADARDAFLAALAGEPLLGKAHYQLSLAYSRLGDPQNAEKHVRLHRTSIQDMEERLNTIRSETGMPSEGGMRP